MSAVILAGAPEGWDAALLAQRRGEWSGAILHVCRDDSRMARMAAALAFFAPETPVLTFPAWDCLPYDRVGPNAEIVSRRIATLAALAEAPNDRARIVLTTVNALVQRIPPRTVFAGAVLDLARGAFVPADTITAFLEGNGYVRAGQVMEPGEYAVRGGILDLWPAGAEEPVRVDLFGDEIDTLKTFDPMTQRSGAEVERIVLRPVSEVLLDQASVERFRDGFRQLAGTGAEEDPLYAAISARHRHQGMEHWLPLFHDKAGGSGALETLLDYLPDASVSFDHQSDEVLTARLEMIADHYEARRSLAGAKARRLAEGEPPYHPVQPGALYLDRTEWEAMLEQRPVARLSPFVGAPGSNAVDAGGRPGRIFADARAAPDVNLFETVRDHARNLARGGARVVIAAWSQGAAERLAHLLSDQGLGIVAVDSWKAAQALPKGGAGITVLGLERGFTAPGIAVVAEQDILGERISRPQKTRKRRAEEVLAQASELAEGDLVVHVDHGIGRYEGLEAITVGQAPHDCLKLAYDGGDRLYLPVENIDLLSRFGSEQAGVSLDKLGGASWQNRKARLKQRIRDMAEALIRTAAERELKGGNPLMPPEGLWDEFCARFPFTETEDQARAIADVLEDLSSGRPMDRLVCGDVGFGKTEVALRAAFIAAMTGQQVAVVVPTTLLARQHFRTFQSRFQGFPLNIAQLSRMVPAKEANAVRKGLEDGSVNIVVGTHAVLAKGISFRDLGLLIIDEEQHFGVAHKERLKQLKAEVHVLTLTATPIPRTLQLALSGVRSMSLIATPPVDRLAVRTFILPFDQVVLREAIARERFRGGQVFYVVPRIEDLDEVAGRLREIVPDVKVLQAHGRLAPTELERVMTAFQEGEADILLSTNIIESGLDMPSVNTLVIHRSDMFGLAQLYQLRGRVGRGKQRGYAYLTVPANRKLSQAAEKRLEVMQTLDTLGAGFTLASHDLDIRGAGNLLGDEQSGQIREVGIELYQSMLADAVAEIREGAGRRTEETWSPQINLGMPVLIPEEYVKDLPIRLGLYRRIGALASDAEGEAMAAELVDRFGSLPAEVQNLLDVVAIKRTCRQAGIDRLEAGPKGIVVGFRSNSFRNPAGLVGWVAKAGGGVKLRPDHKLAMVRELGDATARLRAARELVGRLADLADPRARAA